MLVFTEILAILQRSGQRAVQRLRQQKAQTGAQQRQHAQYNFRQWREYSTCVQYVCAEEGEGVAHHMHCRDSLTAHTCGNELGGILGARIVGHSHAKATNHRQGNQQGGCCELKRKEGVYIYISGRLFDVLLFKL